jgi:hypothetical protein
VASVVASTPVVSPASEPCPQDTVGCGCVVVEAQISKHI